MNDDAYLFDRQRTIDWAMFAPLATVLIWSGNTLVTKAAGSVIAPWSIAFYRWAIALILLAPFVGPAAWRNRAAALRVWPQLAAGGLLGMVLYQCLAYVAAITTSAINMGVILALMPLFSSLLASVFAAERLSMSRIAGAVLSLGGLVYLVSQGRPSALLGNGLQIGDALMLVAVLSNALYGVLLRRWSLTLPIGQQLFWQMAAAVIMLFPLWLAHPISPITAANISLILYAAVPTSLIAPFMWMVGVERLGAGRASVSLNLLPAFIAIGAWVFFGERLHGYHYVGGGIALIGVIIGLREWRLAPSKGGVQARPRFRKSEFFRPIRCRARNKPFNW